VAPGDLQADFTRHPALKTPEHVATIQGPGLRIAENRLLKRFGAGEDRARLAEAGEDEALAAR